MSSALIQVGIAELEGLESRIRGLDCTVDSALYADFSRSGDVADAYSGLMGAWSKNRDEMDQALTRIADSLHTIVESFSQVDSDLAAQLTGSSGGAP